MTSPALERSSTPAPLPDTNEKNHYILLALRPTDKPQHFQLFQLCTLSRMPRTLILNYFILVGANRSSFILNDFLFSVKTDTSNGKPFYF